MSGVSVNYDLLTDVSQTIRYNYAGSDANGNAGYHFCAVYTNMQTKSSATGDIRDTQDITPLGGFQATQFTPEQIYATMNSAAAGTLLATELLNCYSSAIGVTVS